MHFCQYSRIFVLISVFSTVTSSPCLTAWKYFNLTDSCYFTGHYETFAAASDTCIRNDAHLASIHSIKENTYLNGLYSQTWVGGDEKDMTWLGLERTNGSWSWQDGTDMDYKNWKGTPSKTYNCAVQRSTSGWKLQWQAVDCGLTVRKYVCKKPAMKH